MQEPNSPLRNTPQKTLESWKQIAAYLERSERTVRRWEASEGLPVHRREHEKQDTVFAYKHEIEAWSRLRTRCPGAAATDVGESLAPAPPAANAYLSEHDAITRTMHLYIAGCRAGDGDLMRPAFHPSATISGLLPGRGNTPVRSSTSSSGSRRIGPAPRLPTRPLRSHHDHATGHRPVGAPGSASAGPASWPVPIRRSAQEDVGCQAAPLEWQRGCTSDDRPQWLVSLGTLAAGRPPVSAGATKRILGSPRAGARS